MVSKSAAGVDDLLQSAVDGRGAGSRRQSVDAADFEATHDCGEDLVLVHDVSFSCWCAVTHLASCLFSFFVYDTHFRNAFGKSHASLV